MSKPFPHAVSGSWAACICVLSIVPCAATARVSTTRIDDCMSTVVYDDWVVSVELVMKLVAKLEPKWLRILTDYIYIYSYRSQEFQASRT